ncbi:MAG: AAA family ATPase, partial [Solirubrobacteraceae bacterium]|nr:AAA family ATPase [Solirubrobacteraceae bacterium]
MQADDVAELVGRTDELARLRAAIDAAEAGGSRVVVMSGEPGIGKTALLEQAARMAARRGFLVTRGRAAEQEIDVPFGLVVDALDDHVEALPADRSTSLSAVLGNVLPSLGEPVAAPVPTNDTAPAARITLHRALRDLVDALAGPRPIALVLDDLHWADHASLEWILHLMRRPPRAPHLLLLALRPVSPLPPLLDALRNSVPGEHLEVGPLDAEASASLLGAVGDALRRERYLEEARGNPLFLSGLARLPEDHERLPATVLAAVGREVGALDPAARGLLEGAAVVGDPFDADLAVVAAGLDPSAVELLDRLVAADLVRPDRARTFAFRHPLVRRAVHDATPAAARLRAHARAAARLEALGAPVERIAHHVERSASVGDEAAARTLVAAARGVAGRAPGTAAAWLQAALDLAPGAPAPERAQLYAELARALEASGRHVLACDALGEALALAGPDDVALQAPILAALAAVEHVLGRHREARSRLSEALSSLPPDADPVLRAQLTHQLAVGASYDQDVDELRRLAGTSAAALRPVSATAAISDEAIAMIAAMWSGHAEELPWRSASVHGQIDALTAADDPAIPAMAYVVGMADLLTQDLERARETIGLGLSALQTAGEETSLTALTGAAAMAAVIAADAREARRFVAMTEEAARLHGVGPGLAQALWLRASIAMLDGDLEDAARAGAEWPAVAASVGDIHMARTGYCYFALLRAADDPAGALAELRRHAGEDLEKIEQEWSTRRLAPQVVRILLVLGDHDEAERIVEVAQTRAARIGVPVALAGARLARAEVELAGGDPVAALASAQEASTLAASRGFEEERFGADLVVARSLG